MAIIIYWLLMNGLSLFMALFFMSGTEKPARQRPFHGGIPAEVDYHGKKYYGVTGDASETGLSFNFFSKRLSSSRKRRRNGNSAENRKV